MIWSFFFFLKGKNRGILYREYSDILKEILIPTQGDPTINTSGCWQSDCGHFWCFSHPEPGSVMKGSWAASISTSLPCLALQQAQNGIFQQTWYREPYQVHICSLWEEKWRHVGPVSTSLLASSWWCGSLCTLPLLFTYIGPIEITRTWDILWSAFSSWRNFQP